MQLNTQGDRDVRYPRKLIDSVLVGSDNVQRRKALADNKTQPAFGRSFWSLSLDGEW